jgi:hypothetical protein
VAVRLGRALRQMGLEQTKRGNLTREGFEQHGSKEEDNMRFTRLTVGVVAGLLALSMAASAQTIQERVDAIEKKVDEQSKSIGGMLGIDFHAMLSTQYTYSFNRPDSGNIEYRVFDTNDNSIELDQANLYFGRNKADESLGFTTNLDFGRTADVVGSVTCWNRDCDSSEQDNAFELREFYATYKLPFELPEGFSLSVKGGKFVTLLGYEVIKSYNAFNFNASNSIMFGWSVPFTHTGLLASAGLGSMFSVDLGVVNGWDAVVDNNDGKTLLAGFKFTPVSIFSTYVAGTYGAEQPDNGESKRGMITVASTLTPMDMLTLGLDLNWATESDISLEDGAIVRSNHDASWYGAAGYVVVKATDALSFALRAELFDDPDGVRSLFQAGGFGPGVTVWEITPTVSYQITNGLLGRFEYRHDEADKPFFGKQDTFQNGSDTIAFNFIYAL